LLVECLVGAGVPLITCVPGESFLPVLDALHDLELDPAAPRLITTRHEAAAANMAEAAGKLTGRAAVCIVTRGPGATHASIAAHTAYQDGTPLLLVVGQVSRAHLGRGAFQEMDYAHVFGSSAKSVVQILRADDIPEQVTRAMQVAHGGRPGPVVLVIPEDVLAEAATSRPHQEPLPDVPTARLQDLKELHGMVAGPARAQQGGGGAGL
jgi:acetolactate synthase-1/2/3 large subunit